MIILFDYELAKEAVGIGIGKIVTRDGYEVTEISLEDSSDPIYPLSGYIEFDDYPLYNLWTEDGIYNIDEYKHDYDLFLVIDDSAL